VRLYASGAHVNICKTTGQNVRRTGGKQCTAGGLVERIRTNVRGSGDRLIRWVVKIDEVLEPHALFRAHTFVVIKSEQHLLFDSRNILSRHDRVTYCHSMVEGRMTYFSSKIIQNFVTT
jgi:hypothetical protein